MTLELINGQKQAIRNDVLTWLSSLTKIEITKASASINNQLAKLINSSSILVFRPFSTEPQIQNLLEKIKINEEKHTHIYFPDNKELKIYREWDLGVASPEEIARIEIVIVPGLAFTKNGERIGRGRGWYDQMLAQMKNSKKIGVCFAKQIYEILPQDVFDQKVDQVIYD
jgi:5-formyltetrahydrofolate cyclo-ligase